jgi:hypothetical protein
MSERVSREGKAGDAEKPGAPLETPDRPLTIDDVPRLGSGAGIAIGCGMLVVVAIALFWLVRGWLMHG